MGKGELPDYIKQSHCIVELDKDRHGVPYTDEDCTVRALAYHLNLKEFKDGYSSFEVFTATTWMFSTLDPMITTVICDRFITSSEVFINTLYDRKLISSFDKEVLLTTLEDYLTPLPKPDGIIYLKRSAKYCCEKVEEEPHDSHHQDEV